MTSGGIVPIPPACQDFTVASHASRWFDGSAILCVPRRAVTRCYRLGASLADGELLVEVVTAGPIPRRRPVCGLARRRR
jgi:hypothetical protein